MVGLADVCGEADGKAQRQPRGNDGERNHGGNESLVPTQRGPRRRARVGIRPVVGLALWPDHMTEFNAIKKCIKYKKFKKKTFLEINVWITLQINQK